MKKLFIPLLVFLLAFSCIACGQDTAQDPTDTPAIQPQPSETVSQPVDTPPAEPSEVPSEEPSEALVPGVGAENEISAERLAELSALFSIQDGNVYWYNAALWSPFASPDMVDLHELFYSGGSDQSLSEAESAYLETIWPSETRHTDIQKITREEMDSVLQTYFGLSLDETQLVGLDTFVYCEAGDSFFLMHGDTNLALYTFVSGVELENGDVTLFYPYSLDPLSHYYAVTLHLSEEGVWQIVSNLPVTE